MTVRAAARWALWPAVATAASLALHMQHPHALTILGWEGIGEVVRVLSGAGSYFAAAWLAARLVGIAIGRTATRRRLPKLLQELVATALFVAASIATAVLVFGQPVSGVLAGSGLLLAILGFAIRNALADVLSGIALGLEAPYRIGDWVEIDTSVRGRIVEIGWRTTRLLTRDDTYTILPNSQIARQRLTNYSAPRRHYRTNVHIVLSHAIPVALAKGILSEAAARPSIILVKPAPDVRVVAYDPDGIRYAVRFWVPSFAEDVDCRDAVFSAIDVATRERDLPPPRPCIGLACGMTCGQGGARRPGPSAAAAG